MPLPAELDREIRSQFEGLVSEGQRLLASFNAADKNQYCTYEEWCVKASGLVHMLYGQSDEGNKYQTLFEKRWDTGSYFWGFSHEVVLAKVSQLRGLKYNYENGFLDSLQEQIVANVSADYIEQAERLLGEGIPGQYNHVLAAMLCGVVLEDNLRRLCHKQIPPIEITKSNGQKKTMEPLIQDLQRTKVFNKLVADQLRAWTKIRNYAVHGESDEFRPEDVDLMLSGVRHFLAVHL